MQTNTVTIKKRTLVRIVSYGTAATLAFAGLFCVTDRRERFERQTLEYTYMRAMGDLAGSVDNIKSTLNKGLYAGSASQMVSLSGKLRNDSGAAKAYLAQLPSCDLPLDKTNKFLSQVGNYAAVLAKKVERGEKLTDDERGNLKQLYEYADTLSGEMLSVQSQIQNGYITFNVGKKKDTASTVSAAGKESEPGTVTDGFADVENGFDNYPQLIYDGPFSDHIMQRKPRLTKGAKNVSLSNAEKTAAQRSGVSGLKYISESGGNMPVYEFQKDGTTVSVTKEGGLYAYMLSYREVDDRHVSNDKAVSKGQSYLKKAGFENMTKTYYESKGGVCTINFAGLAKNAAGEDVTLYTDLIKVGVALDNADVLSFDARGYIVNHTKRSLPAPKLSAQEAMSKLSGDLKVRETKLSVIPSEGLEERYCYEFLVDCPDNKKALVYINCNTGEEEQILLMQITDGGVLVS
ncbi:germination protein YpeB [Clostridia bacterium]|nr:germination protein YpeB [Clostridia bacterium]